VIPVGELLTRFPRARRPLLWVGYLGFAMAVALLTLFVTLPRDRIKDRIEAMLSGDPTLGGIGMDVSIGDFGLTLFTGAGVRGKDVVLRSRPVSPTEKPARYVLDEATVHVGLFGLLFNRPGYSFKVRGLSGLLTGAVSSAADETRMKIELSGVVLNGVQAVQASVGLPLEGKVSGKFEMVAPKGLAGNADGKLELHLEDAVLGDGKAKLTIPGDPFLSQGVTFPRIQLGALAATVPVEKGRARLEGVAMRSPDGEVMLDGYIELHDPLSMSNLHGYLRFKPADKLVKREPTIELMTNALSSTARRTDGALGFQMTGTFGAPFFLPSREPPGGVVLKSVAPEAPSHPTVSAIPVGAPAAPPAAPPPPGPIAEPTPPPPPAPAPAPEPAPSAPQQQQQIAIPPPGTTVPVPPPKAKEPPPPKEPPPRPETPPPPTPHPEETPTPEPQKGE
jgi:type II secretion system protein N